MVPLEDLNEINRFSGPLRVPVFETESCVVDKPLFVQNEAHCTVVEEVKPEREPPEASESSFSDGVVDRVHHRTTAVSHSDVSESNHVDDPRDCAPELYVVLALVGQWLGKGDLSPAFHSDRNELELVLTDCAPNVRRRADPLFQTSVVDVGDCSRAGTRSYQTVSSLKIL